MTPRTKEEFDAWFADNGGDPWGYQGKSIQTRLCASLKFILSHGKNYSGTFLELGAFDGSFTKYLASSFPEAKIIAVDISEGAINKNREINGNNPNVTFICCDMLSFDYASVANSPETIVLLMESLYYLSEQERFEVVSTISEVINKNIFIYISCPITGGKYFSEESLLSLMKRVGYKLYSFSVLNLRGRFTLSKIIQWLANHNGKLRGRFANQVIYKFKRGIK